MKNKGIITVILIVALLCSATAFAANQFADIEGHWAEAQIREWIAAGLVAGYTDGTFRPNHSVSRAEFFVWINRAFQTPAAATGASFADVPLTAWYYNDISAALAAGITTGYPDGTFRPQNPITRQEAAAVLARQLDLPDAAGTAFADNAAIADWAKNAVAAVSAAGMMGGYPDGTFGPQKPITRAETVIILDRGRHYAAAQLPQALSITAFTPGNIKHSWIEANTWLLTEDGANPERTVGEVSVTFNQNIDKRDYESFDIRAYDEAGTRLAFVSEDVVKILLYDKFKGGTANQIKGTIDSPYAALYSAMDATVLGEADMLEIDIYNRTRSLKITVRLFLEAPK